MDRVEELETTPAVNPADDVRDAVRQLRTRLLRRSGGEDPVLLDFLEDDLREGRRALAEVEAFFDEVVETLARPDARPIDLVDLADGTAVLDQLEYLGAVASNLRRRVLQISTMARRR